MAKKQTNKAEKPEAVKLPEVDVLQTNDAKGLPEAGASIGLLACCTIASL
jgi:hypothetical protein